MTNPSPLVSQAPPDLVQIQAPVRDRLDQILEEIRRIVVADVDMIEEVNEYLLLLPGKLFRPTLVLLSNEVGGSPNSDAVTFGAVVDGETGLQQFDETTSRRVDYVERAIRSMVGDALASGMVEEADAEH